MHEVYLCVKELAFEPAAGRPCCVKPNPLCCYCGVGCGVIVEHYEITGVRGDPEHPANFGKLCSNPGSLHLSAQKILQQQARVITPLDA